MNRIMAPLLAIGLLTFATPGLTAVYKWVDKDGNVHFGNAPPPSSTSEKIRLGGPTLPPKSPEQKTETPKADPADAETPSVQDVETSEKSDGTDKKAEYCERAQSNLKLLLSGQRLRVKEGEEYHFMTDEERAQRIDETQKQIQEFCN